MINASENDVLAALDTLKSQHLVLEGSGSRVPRFEHNVARVLKLPGQSVALLAMMMLRGPQTAAELRANCERLHRFADVSSVEAFLDELQGKAPPWVRKLARAPGAREARWAHLLCGEPPADIQAAAPGAAPDSALVTAVGELAAIKAEQARLLAQIEELRATVARLGASLDSQRKEG